MSNFELCTITQKRQEKTVPAAQVEPLATWWVEVTILKTNGAIEVAKSPSVEGPLGQPPQQVTKARQRLDEQLAEQGWRGLEGGYYRQVAGNGNGMSKGAELDRLLGLVMDRTQNGSLDPQIGNTMRDMLIELITMAAMDPSMPDTSVWSGNKGGSLESLEARRDKLDPRQLERRRFSDGGRKNKKHIPEDSKDKSWDR